MLNLCVILELIDKINLTLDQLDNKICNFIKLNKNVNSLHNINNLDLLNDILKTNTISDIAISLNISNGTITRWILLKNIPHQYYFELTKLNNKTIDYSKFSYKEKDQFFTPPHTALYCYNQVLKILKEYKDDETAFHYIEPSAGSGNFLNLLPIDRSIGVDIEPRTDNIINYDYLKWQPNLNNKYIVIGNPPFGLRGQLALKFINYSYNFADYVCFILPQLFISDGKGSPRKRVIGYNLIHSENLNTNFIDPDEKPILVQCIFQIWSKYHKNNIYNISTIKTDTMSIYSLSNGGTPSSTRNKQMHDICDIYIPSTCFGKINMKYYNKFENLPGCKGYGIIFKKNKELNINKFKTINWSDVAFLSTNSAYNIRSSQISKLFE